MRIDAYHKLVFLLSSFILSFQFCRVPFPAHGCSGSPRWHALRTFRHIPSQPFTLQFLALGVRRLGTKSQPARGAVFQRLHALLRESPKTESRCALFRGVTSSLQPHSLTDVCLSSQTVTVCASYSAVTNSLICHNETREESHPSIVEKTPIT